MKNSFKILIAVLIVFALLIIWGVFRFFIENKPIHIDTSILDTIAETDWSNTNMLEAKEMSFVGKMDDRWSFVGYYGEEETSYSVQISTISPEDNQDLLSYKNIQYHAFKHTNLSLKSVFSRNDDVERHFLAYVDGVRILVIEHNKSKEDFAFYRFFEENNESYDSGSPVKFYNQTQNDYSKFIEENGCDKNVGVTNNENIAAEKAMELWASELGEQAENFIGGPEIYVYYDTSNQYWIAEGTYPKNILSHEYETKNDFLVPTTIIRPDGKIIANGWR